MILRNWNEQGQRIALRRRGDVLELLLGNVVLLSSAALETERAFGRLAGAACARALLLEPAPRIIVGGLGFGATTQGVLDVAPRGARVIVSEKLEAVIDVARNEAAHLAGAPLADPRVTVEHADVADVIAREAKVTAILLDVDNGPEWASFRGNARLYADAALATAFRALAPGGIFAVWSGYPADSFLVRLRHAGFQPRIEPLTERGVVRARAYLGQKP